MDLSKKEFVSRVLHRPAAAVDALPSLDRSGKEARAANALRAALATPAVEERRKLLGTFFRRFVDGVDGKADGIARGLSPATAAALLGPPAPVAAAWPPSPSIVRQVVSTTHRCEKYEEDGLVGTRERLVCVRQYSDGHVVESTLADGLLPQGGECASLSARVPTER